MEQFDRRHERRAEDLFLDPVRVLVESAIAATILSSDAERRVLQRCWVMLAAYEVPRALSTLTGREDRSLGPGDPRVFFDLVEGLVDEVAAVVGPYVDPEGARVAARAGDESALAGSSTVQRIADQCAALKMQLMAAREAAQLSRLAVDGAASSRIK